MLSTMPDSRELQFLWQAVLGRLELDLSPASFSTWLAGTRALRLEGETLIVEGGGAFECTQLNGDLQIVIRRAVHRISGRDLETHFVPAGSQEGARGPGPRNQVRSLVGSTNCAYTFERYLPAEGNLVALQACRALVEEDEVRVISPIVVWGSPGLGKSHLLHALACSAVEAGWQVACLTAEEFSNRYHAALRGKRVDEFQDALREVQLLVIDDLQYLKGRAGTLDELGHTIDAITNAGGHVAVGSERHPGDLDLPGRLASRLSAGVVTRIEPFRLEERKEYIAERTRAMRASLPSWAAERIANLEVPSVRALQGAVNAAVMLGRASFLEPGRLDAELLRVALAEAAPAVCRDRELLEAVARQFETTYAELVGRSRKSNVAEARAVAVALLREEGHSLARLAGLLDGRDKSTISQLGDRGAAALKARPSLRQLAG